jgi:hypothetical protein
MPCTLISRTCMGVTVGLQYLAIAGSLGSKLADCQSESCTDIVLSPAAAPLHARLIRWQGCTAEPQMREFNLAALQRQ